MNLMERYIDSVIGPRIEGSSLEDLELKLDNEVSRSLQGLVLFTDGTKLACSAQYYTELKAAAASGRQKVCPSVYGHLSAHGFPISGPMYQCVRCHKSCLKLMEQKELSVLPRRKR